MKNIITFLILLMISSAAFGQGKEITYEVNGNKYEGYSITGTD